MMLGFYIIWLDISIVFFSKASSIIERSVINHVTCTFLFAPEVFGKYLLNYFFFDKNYISVTQAVKMSLWLTLNKIQKLLVAY